MFNRWNTLEHWADLDPTFNLFDEMRRRMDRIIDDDRPRAHRGRAVPFQAVLHDDGEAFVLQADLPGVKVEDVHLTLEDGVLTVKAERKAAHREGFTTHRQERHAVKLGRAFPLPAKVDPELTRASMRDGVLTVTVGKAPESKPRQIQVSVA